MKTIDDQKQIMREIVQKEAMQLTAAYCKAADLEIYRNITELTEYKGARTIFCYVGARLEVDTMLILKDILQKGKTLAVPKCIGQGIMVACQIKSLTELQSGKYGILEPDNGCIKIEPAVIDLGIIPCQTCGSDGRRLGHGGGYYDRYLGRVNFMKVALCRSKLLKENIPMGEYDVKMDVVISEEGVKTP